MTDATHELTNNTPTLTDAERYAVEAAIDAAVVAHYNGAIEYNLSPNGIFACRPVDHDALRALIAKLWERLLVPEAIEAAFARLVEHGAPEWPLGCREEMPGLDLAPPSEAPTLARLDHDDAVEAMVEWFWENFEDPAHETPWDEGAYVFIWGGPYDAREELEEAFADAATERAIAEAVDEIEGEGTEWAPSASRIVAEHVAPRPEPEPLPLGAPRPEPDKITHMALSYGGGPVRTPRT